MHRVLSDGLRILMVFGSLLAVAPAQAPAIALAVKGLPGGAPLAVTASHDGSALVVQVELEEGWHLYARDVGGGQPVAVRIDGGAFAAAGKLVTPAGEDGLIEGKAELRLPLRRLAEGDELRATMTFMACDALQCLPPMEVQLVAPAALEPGPPAKPFPVLLVAVDEGERTQRVASFLRERGFVPSVATYTAVTAAQCDAHEVVVADSPTFGQLRGKGVNARTFPATASPVVAVGFLGTQLLEAQKVTMACGYV